jgi:hypothetical protein
MNRVIRRIFKGISLALILTGSVSIWMGTFHHLFPSEVLKDYPVQTGNVSKIAVERFIGERDRDYFEFAIYLEGERRFFVRAPEESELPGSLRSLRVGDTIRVYHLPYTEYGRGSRAVSVFVGNTPVLGLQDVLSRQKKRERFMKLLGMAFFMPGVAGLFAFRLTRR